MSFFLSGFELGSPSLQLTVIATSCITIIAGFRYINHQYRYWQRLGIRGPSPVPFFGHILHFVISNSEEAEKRWAQIYGKIYGIYVGTSPRLIVADPEVVHQICIKDFDSFVDHAGFVDLANKYQRSFIFFILGDRWRKVRALMSPTFTSGKLKRMFRFLDGCADDLVDCIREQLNSNSNIINAKDVYSLYTMDAISTCCYGLKMERDKSTANLQAISTRNEFVRLAVKLFEINLFRLLIGVAVPRRLLKKLKFYIIPESYFEPLAVRIQALIENRKSASGKKFEDYLQLLIDAKLGDKLDVSETDFEENHHACLDSKRMFEDQQRMVEQAKLQINGNVDASKLKLTDQEALSGAIFLMVVGLETTGNLLTSVSYALAFHQEVQEKLYDEIMKIAELDESKKRYTFQYESLTSCHYLDSVISETLRTSPPVIVTDRRATSDYRIEKYNLTVPKNEELLLAIYALQNDPDYWTKPEKFDPERFMPGNRESIVPGTYLPFGLGPRYCIGMRFSLTEAKLAVAKMMANFKIEPAPNTIYPATPGWLNLGLRKFKNPVVRMIPRVKSL